MCKELSKDPRLIRETRRKLSTDAVEIVKSCRLEWRVHLLDILTGRVLFQENGRNFHGDENFFFSFERKEREREKKRENVLRRASNFSKSLSGYLCAI